MDELRKYQEKSKKHWQAELSMLTRDACAYLRQVGKAFSEGTSMNVHAPPQG